MDASEFTSVPAFSSFSSTRVNAIIAEAGPWFDAGRWGAFYHEGLWNFVAHRISLELGGFQSTDARVTNKTVGRESIARNVEVGAHDTFLTTMYGQRYAELRDMVGLGGFVVPVAWPVSNVPPPDDDQI
jgi:hypothetical protein